VNPGGPGASGVNLVLELGDFLSKTVFGTQYNIVGFDPRGVNNSGIDLDICDKSKTDSPRGPRWIQSALPLRWRQDKTNLVATGGFHPSEKIISFQHNLQVNKRPDLHQRTRSFQRDVTSSRKRYYVS